MHVKVFVQLDSIKILQLLHAKHVLPIVKLVRTLISAYLVMEENICIYNNVSQTV